MIQGVVVLMGAYLLGGVPFGLALHRFAGFGDIRTKGSGNIGATNVFRSAGKRLGIATLVLDIGKGALAVAVAGTLTEGSAWTAAAAVATVAGHCYPVYLGFRGGKGIAAGCGAYGVLTPGPTALSLLIFLSVMLTTRMVSAGSIVAGLSLPLLILWLQPQRAFLISAIATVVLVTWRHHGNIRRIISGGEHRIDGS